jgi:hypothetical protein
MKELFEILKANNCINNIPIDDLTALFVNKDNSQYDIAMVGKGKIVLKDKTNNKFEKFDCVCNYFDVGSNTECIDICKCIGCEQTLCDRCFACASNKLNTGELNVK